VSVTKHFAWLFGPYRTPFFRFAAVVPRAVRGRVTLVGLQWDRLESCCRSLEKA
jgi:hypothetical protein